MPPSSIVRRGQRRSNARLSPRHAGGAGIGDDWIARVRAELNRTGGVATFDWVSAADLTAGDDVRFRQFAEMMHGEKRRVADSDPSHALTLLALVRRLADVHAERRWIVPVVTFWIAWLVHHSRQPVLRLHDVYSVVMEGVANQIDEDIEDQHVDAVVTEFVTGDGLRAFDALCHEIVLNDDITTAPAIDATKNVHYAVSRMQFSRKPEMIRLFQTSRRMAVAHAIAL